jgi:hypothetical protein
LRHVGANFCHFPLDSVQTRHLRPEKRFKYASATRSGPTFSGFATGSSYQRKTLKDIVIGQGKNVDFGHVVLEEDVDHPWYGKIFYPGRMNRAIRKVGESLDIVFKAKKTTTVNRVVLSTDYKELVGFLGPLTYSFKLWLAGGRGCLQCCV